MGFFDTLFGPRPRHRKEDVESFCEVVNLTSMVESRVAQQETGQLVLKALSQFADIYPFVSTKRPDITVTTDGAVIGMTVRCRNADHAKEMLDTLDRLLAAKGLTK
jgi:hypothetical protein